MARKNRSDYARGDRYPDPLIEPVLFVHLLVGLVATFR